MYCSYCGTEINDDARFCSYCGKPQRVNLPSKSDGLDESNGDFPEHAIESSDEPDRVDADPNKFDFGEPQAANDEEPASCIEYAGGVPVLPAENIDDQDIPETAPEPEEQSDAIPDIPNYLVESILVTLLCCLPMGAFAIYYANEVNKHMLRKDYESARNASSIAGTWCFASLLGFALVVYLLIASHHIHR